MRRAFFLFGLTGASCIVVAVFLPIAADQQGSMVRDIGPSLIHYYEGLIFLALAAAAVCMLVLSQSGRAVMFVSPLVLIALGLVLNVYSTAVSSGRLLEPCNVRMCAIRTGPAGGLGPATSPLDPGVAFQVLATGAILLIASGVVLAASSSRRVARTGERPTRSHPVWM